MNLLMQKPGRCLEPQPSGRRLSPPVGPWWNLQLNPKTRAVNASSCSKSIVQVVGNIWREHINLQNVEKGPLDEFPPPSARARFLQMPTHTDQKGTAQPTQVMSGGDTGLEPSFASSSSSNAETREESSLSAPTAWPVFYGIVPACPCYLGLFFRVSSENRSPQPRHLKSSSSFLKPQQPAFQD